MKFLLKHLFLTGTLLLLISFSAMVFSLNKGGMTPKTFRLVIGRECDRSGKECWNPSSPVVFNGKIFVGDYSGMVSAINQNTGQIVWRYRTLDPYYTSTPTADNDSVFVNTLRGGTYRLNAEDGLPQWYTGYTVRQNQPFHPVVSGNLVLSGEEDNVYVLDRAAGSKKWIYYLYDASFISVITYNDYLLVGSYLLSLEKTTMSQSKESAAIYAFNKYSGKIEWTFAAKNKETAIGSPCVLQDDLYAIGYKSNKPSNLYRLDARTGQQIWVSSLNVTTDINTYCNKDTVYVKDKNKPVLYALDAAKGKLKWKFQAPTRIYSIFPDNEIVYFGTGGNLYALNTNTGQLKWKFTADGAVSSTPVVNHGIVYFMTSIGTLYALDANTGKL